MAMVQRRRGALALTAPAAEATALIEAEIEGALAAAGQAVDAARAVR